ncbi:50S ribosomal protein L11 methyltransferase [Segatella paludivivens]|uniref:50S ribosomal protein L11 methyltransferase n=1 Tax=Segatella paludivivens TaxID=185294 RepID=UPI0003666E82|nr:50S ribosomal protein L11 methyltransferase [Segatella paludivivens]
MKYFEISYSIKSSIDVFQTARDLLADAAGEAGCESFEETSDGLIAYCQVDNWDEDLMKKSIEDFIIPNVEISYNVKYADDKDWNQEWEEKGFEPINIDNKIIVCDAKKPLPKGMPSNTEHIFIDAKLAFGTGTHETTRMIVSTLLHLDLKDKMVLDCGCGTGILGLAAAKLGASNVVAYDIDEWSVNNARHNAEINAIGNISVYQGDSNVLNHISGIFDIVMANINRNILLNDMPTFKSLMTTGSLLILSGFYQSDIPVLLDKAKELGLEEYGRKQDGEWACLVLLLNQ